MCGLEKMNDLKGEFLEAMDGFRIVDHHDHLGELLFKQRVLEVDLPFFIARGYVHSDLVSAGLPDSFYKGSQAHPNVPETFAYLMEGRDESEKAWNRLAPYVQRVRNTIYFQYLRIALEDLYGFEREEFGDDWRELSEKIRAKSRENPAWGLKLLRDIGVYRVILDISGPVPRTGLAEDERLTHIVRMDGFIMGNMNVVGAFRDNEPVRSLEEYLEALDEAFEKAAKARAVGVKSGLAYQRIIEYREVSRYEAEKALTEGLQNVSSEARRSFQDFIMHQVCERCAEFKMPFQIHTGIQAGNYNTITNAKPTHLTNLLRKYPDVKFDIFHGGYPYFREAGLLAKYFPNAYIDGCWLTHISPSTYMEALNEWLEIVPATKIFAWGGDHGIPDHTYASLKLARELIAEVLARKVARGSFSMKTALWAAERIMGENAIEVYGF